MSQELYVDDLLVRHGELHTASVTRSFQSPVEENADLSPPHCPAIDSEAIVAAHSHVQQQHEHRHLTRRAQLKTQAGGRGYRGEVLPYYSANYCVHM